MIKTIFSFTVYAIVFLAAFPLSLLAILIRLLGMRKLSISLSHAIARIWAKFIIWTTASTVTVRGVENIPKDGSVCFVGNHQGYFDIIIALAYIPRSFGFIAKKELFWFPMVGLWIYALNGLFLDRKNARRAMKSIHEGAKRIERGDAMIIFPEGTRDRGKALLPFHPGSFKLATLANASIIPLAISGAYKVWEEHKRVCASEVFISFGAPIPTADMQKEEKKALAEKTRKSIEGMLPN